MSSNLFVSHKCIIILTKVLFLFCPPQLSPLRYNVFTFLSILFLIYHFNKVHTSFDPLPPHRHDTLKLYADLQSYVCTQKTLTVLCQEISILNRNAQKRGIDHKINTHSSNICGCILKLISRIFKCRITLLCFELEVWPLPLTQHFQSQMGFLFLGYVLRSTTRIFNLLAKTNAS